MYPLKYPRAPIVIWKFPVANALVKYPHISSIFINIVEYVDKFYVFHQFITNIIFFRHKFPLCLKELHYISKFMGYVVISHKRLT